MLAHQFASKEDTVAILEHMTTYIAALAGRKIPRHTLRTETMDMEIDDLAQQVSIKLWQALQKGHVINPVGYTKSIVSTTAIDMQRRYKPTHALSDEEDSDLYRDGGMQDPSRDIEQDE